MDRVALIREHVPDVALTTDIIVGFPGETEADFRETLEVVEEVGYDGAFTFIFSRAAAPRPPRSPTPSRTRRRSSGCSGSSRSSSAARASARSGSSGARSRCSSRAPRAPTRAACAAARAQQGRQLRRPRRAGEYVDVEIPEATSQTLAGEQVSLLVPAADASLPSLRTRTSVRALGWSAGHVARSVTRRWRSSRRPPRGAARADRGGAPLQGARGARHPFHEIRAKRAQPRAAGPRGPVRVDGQPVSRMQSCLSIAHAG